VEGHQQPELFSSQFVVGNELENGSLCHMVYSSIWRQQRGVNGGESVTMFETLDREGVILQCITKDVDKFLPADYQHE
jgi:hypothetical protein